MVIACYGMNDGIYHPYSKENFEAYENRIYKLISSCENMGIKLLLLTPPFFHAPSYIGGCLPMGSADYSYEKPYEGYANVLEIL